MVLGSCEMEPGLDCPTGELCDGAGELWDGPEGLWDRTGELLYGTWAWRAMGQVCGLVSCKCQIRKYDHWALAPGHWGDAVGVVLYVQSHSTARGSRPTALQVQQTAPQAIPQAYRFIPQFSCTIPQFPSRCQAPSHSSLAPFYITPVSC